MTSRAKENKKEPHAVPQIEYAEIALPNFGPPQVEPEIPVATYAARLRETRERAAYSGTTHCSSMATASISPISPI